MMLSWYSNALQALWIMRIVICKWFVIICNKDGQSYKRDGPYDTVSDILYEFHNMIRIWFSYCGTYHVISDVFLCWSILVGRLQSMKTVLMACGDQTDKEEEFIHFKSLNIPEDYKQSWILTWQVAAKYKLLSCYLLYCFLKNTMKYCDEMFKLYCLSQGNRT